MSEDEQAQRPACWAAAIGGCGETMSREHVVSKSLFDSTKVIVHGFHWCKDEPKTIGIQGITAKILCREHNSALSPLDAAAGEAFDAFRQNAKRNGEIHKRSMLTALQERPFTIDAKLLERWLLKTLLNLTYEGKYLIGTSGTDKGIPPLDLVEICYGIRPFPGGAGMYVAAGVGMQIKTNETLSFCPLIKEDDESVHGGFFIFQGVRMALSLLPEGFPFPLSSLPFLDKDWRSARLYRRLEAINIQHSPMIAQPVIKFNW